MGGRLQSIVPLDPGREVLDDINRWQVVVERCPTRSRGDVRHVLEVLPNMISISQLDDEGYTGSIQNGVMKFSKGSLIVARARKIKQIVPYACQDMPGGSEHCSRQCR